MGQKSPQPANNFAMKMLLAQSKLHLGIVRDLFVEYANSIETDLCFQNFKQELDGLPGNYAPPEGRLWLAVEAEEYAGCVGLRKSEEGICEMKRLYVRPAFRGQGLGRLLAQSVIETAHEIGYLSMRLDTLPSMKQAIALYESMGFLRIAPYYHNPQAGAIYMERRL